MVIGVNDESVLDIICELLGSNGIAIVPCDTIYGIVGKARASYSDRADTLG